MTTYPCVAMIIENPSQEVLLLLRDNKPEIAYPNYWSLVGGHIEAGETADQAALRELNEEVGLNLSLFLWKRYNFQYAPNVIVDQYIFVGKVDSENPAMILGEGQAMRFFNCQDIKELKIGFGFEFDLNEYFDLRNDGVLKP
ncbi:MAG: NUDIX domain-containing protein [Chloroflexi bacterium]|nr:NUDIX domain-containing protein [Chloroflexota bacterium]